MWFFYFKKMIKKNNLLKVLYAYLAIAIVGCSTKENTLFFQLPVSKTKIDFNNKITESNEFNILTNEYIFNGGGVAVSDFNNDDLPDLYFTGNQVENRLYINSSDLIFKDITSTSRTAAKEMWSTGVAVADVNSDGWMDIYVCAAMLDDKRNNMLFINQGLNENGIPTFDEQAKSYGLNSSANSMAASFLDYNKDGLLDLYVVNNEQSEINPNNYRKKITNGTATSNDQLYRNNGDGTFTDVSDEAGVLIEGYGLSVSIFDFNNDSWPDIYVTNDYLTNDILYVNQQDGTYKNMITKYISHQSKFSMGSDVGDFNNDGYSDLITLDMLGETNSRKKTTISGSSYIQENLNNRWNYEDQHIRNMLFMGNGTSQSFSEIGKLAGVYQTDWSWSPLFADLDNDGLKDLMITNGFPRDITDMDFANYRFDVQRFVSKTRLLDSIPVVKISNYSYKNNGDMSFIDQTESWGLKIPSFSNGAVYSDLDLDGDLDYVVNNINDLAFVFENKTDHKTSDFIQIKLKGPSNNPKGLGSKVVVRFDDGSFQFHELYISKGYMSSVEAMAHFGLGKGKKLSNVEILWPDGKYSNIKGLMVNRRHEINYDDAQKINLQSLKFPLNKKDASKTYSEVSMKYGIDHLHEEQQVNDYAYQRLLPRKLSENGPSLEVGDLNGDGLEDFLVGSSFGYSPVIFFQTESGIFEKKILFDNAKMLQYEIESMALFDLENDGDLDLYMVSGGGQFKGGNSNLQDRLFINDGLGYFTLNEIDLPIFSNGSVVTISDFDKDGYIDLFVGARNVPEQFPNADKSYLLKNIKGVLTPIDLQNNIEFNSLGMVSDAKWVDIDGDFDDDLVVVGEYSSIQIFKNNKGEFNKIINKELENNKGLWRCIEIYDKDNDGDFDLLIGNFGSNNMYNISQETPLNLISKDIDDNGSIDPIIFTYQKNKNGEMESYPIQFWKNLIDQSPFFRQKFNSYEDFSNATINDYKEDKAFEGAKILSVNQDKSMIIENLGNDEFKAIPLPQEAQLAPLNCIFVKENDFSKTQLFLTGNDMGGNPFEGNHDGFRGLILESQKNQEFSIIQANDSGFNIPGNAKDIVKIKLKNGDELIIVAQNQDRLLVFKKDLN